MRVPISRTKFNFLLKRYEKCLQPGGEPTPFTEHRINSGDHLPVAVPPYRKSPSKKETLKQEIDRLLAEGIIEECESPYISPVVLIPKANGTMRLCIDYRKLNSITVPDSYPLPRMDDLLHEAKPTPFMSAIDLKAVYHQVKSPKGRLGRWALEIQAFNLKVLYVAGKANVVADMLSRPVCDEKESPYKVCNIAIAYLPVRSAKDMREAQLADENLKKIIGNFESTQKTEDYAIGTERGFLMNQGVLYRYLPDADSEEAQLVIPSSERDSIMGKTP
ncbi:Retrovirus-related Pol polyprotein like [Argiope bruennichi]|uniref:Retrovirus-related Pol polyprotein like n=1 Tax=Argiope bruennichi TaxID=94029 RepID=A0A8T0G2B0_ARGBR|nr:Retrovirus-related Pol polyprotein like [Argiope bruennichi]